MPPNLCGALECDAEGADSPIPGTRPVQNATTSLFIQMRNFNSASKIITRRSQHAVSRYLLPLAPVCCTAAMEQSMLVVLIVVALLQHQVPAAAAAATIETQDRGHASNGWLAAAEIPREHKTKRTRVPGPLFPWIDRR